MKKLLLTLFLILATASISFAATNSYDKYGSKTGSYKRLHPAIIHMINMVLKRALINKLQADIILTTSMETRQEATKQTQMAEQLPTINTAIKQIPLAERLNMINTEIKSEVINKICF